MLSRLITLFLIDLTAFLSLLIVLSRILVFASSATLVVATLVTIITAEPLIDVVLTIVVAIGLLVGTVLG